MDLPEAKRGANAFDLLDVVGDRVEARAARGGGLPATKLVDGDDPRTKLGQVLGRQKIVVGGTGAALQAEEGGFCRPFRCAIGKGGFEELWVVFGRVHC